MADVNRIGQAGLQGWRAKAGDLAAPAIAERTPLKEDQVRALIGGLFVVLAAVYLVKTAGEISREIRGG